jgi:NitT/TauT family transport system permease protein
MWTRHLTWITTPLVAAIFIGTWQLYVNIGGISPFILPAPTHVATAFVALLHDPTTYRHMGVTLYEAIGGFVLGSLVGVTLGFLLGKIAWLERTLRPFIIATQVTPKVALIPLFILWFGFGPSSKVVVAAVLSFFPIMSNTLLGVKSLDPGHRDVMRSFRAGRAARFMLLELPSTLPYVLTGMEVGIVLAMIGAVVGEFLAGTQGLGQLAVGKLNAFEVDALFGVIILLALTGSVLYFVVSWLKRLIIPWHASASTLGGT